MSERRVFVDTSAWYALNASDDDYHQEASETLRRLLAEKVGLYTTSLVVGETYTLLRMRRGHSAAWRFFDGTLASPRLNIVRLRDVDEDAAVTLMRRYADHQWSFVDGTSFVTMKANRIRHAFAYDDDFEVAGFQLL